MGRVVVLGEAARVDGFALAGATVIVAEGAGEVVRAWDQLPLDAEVIVLSSAAAIALEGAPPARDGTVVVVMPS
jgi:vacuolar-type H+-ATPase subunit F/Vma7